jgi:hypothetical protein
VSTSLTQLAKCQTLLRLRGSGTQPNLCWYRDLRLAKLGRGRSSGCETERRNSAGLGSVGALLVNWQECQCHLIDLARIMLAEGEFIPAEQPSSTNAGEQLARGD